MHPVHTVSPLLHTNINHVNCKCSSRGVETKACCQAETPASKVPRRFLKASDAVLAKPERVRKPLPQKAKRTFIF